MLSYKEISALLERKWTVSVIMFYGRSGSYFLNNLLDGHPELISPKLTLVQACYPHLAKGYDCYDRPNIYSRNEIKEWIAVFSEIKCWKDCFGSQNFTKILYELLEPFDFLSRRDLFLIINIACHISVYGDEEIPSKIIFQLHGHDSRHIRKLIQDFEDCNFMHMVREPLESFISHHWHHMYDFKFKNIMAKAICNAGAPSFPAVKNCSVAIRLEELKSRPESLMRKISSYLDISWDDCLLVPSVSGVLHDSILGQVAVDLESFKTVPLEKWPWFSSQSTRKSKPTLFSPEESEAIEIALTPYYKSWHYKQKWIKNVDASDAENCEKALAQFENKFSYPNLNGLSDEFDGRIQFKDHIRSRMLVGRDEKPLKLFTTDDDLYF